MNLGVLLLVRHRSTLNPPPHFTNIAHTPIDYISAAAGWDSATHKTPLRAHSQVTEKSCLPRVCSGFSWAHAMITLWRKHNTEQTEGSTSAVAVHLVWARITYFG